MNEGEQLIDNGEPLYSEQKHFILKDKEYEIKESGEPDIKESGSFTKENNQIDLKHLIKHKLESQIQ